MWGAGKGGGGIGGGGITACASYIKEYIVHAHNIITSKGTPSTICLFYITFISTLFHMIYPILLLTPSPLICTYTYSQENNQFKSKMCNK